jgi:ribose-phosphate pyrophosphokinase
MKILAGLSQQKLAIYLSKKLDCEYVETSTTTFNDSETRVQIYKDLYNCDVVIVQSTSKPVNNHLIELLLLIDAVKRMGARRITGVIPYLGYSRQDRRSYNFAPVSARLIANLLEVAGVDRIITVDLHSQQLEGFFNIPIQNLDSIHLINPVIKAQNISVIVSPDVGGFVRVCNINKLFNLDVAVINKTRGDDNKCQISDIMGKVYGKHCLLVDDIVDSGQTLCKSAEILSERGALSVNAFITHPVLSDTSKENIQNSNIASIYVTDTIETADLPPKFQIMSIAPIVAIALQESRRV